MFQGFLHAFNDSFVLLKLHVIKCLASEIHVDIFFPKKIGIRAL